VDVLAAKSFVPIYRLPAGGFAILTVSSDRGNRVLKKALAHEEGDMRVPYRLYRGSVRDTRR
jgi:hypothetical protein